MMSTGFCGHPLTCKMIGTLVLWINWPAFNGILTGPRQETSITNTVLSLTGSAVITFLLSGGINKGRYNMVHIQNATLAGGVAMGASCNLVEHPVHALLVGTFAGAVSVWGYVFLSDFLLRNLQLHDTCGIHNLHGMPGIIGALASLIFLPSEMVGPQAATLAITIVIAVGGGLITGVLLLYCAPLPTQGHMKDQVFWMDGTYQEQLVKLYPPSEESQFAVTRGSFKTKAVLS
mmetsp:Transcript_3204/g.6343  ORF Transcript_3204/g.6343 Transcript_3204/m.6343 type:complete len:233 (-) Transcript_3204:302-1000(-)